MEMVGVISSAIQAVGYDPRQRRMKIKFTQGYTYDFCRVPPEIYEGLLQAKSKGVYYNHYIKDRYPCH